MVVEAFWGSGPFQETSADTFTFVRAAVTFIYEFIIGVQNLFKSECVTGAPGVAPVAGKPGLTMGIMGAPGAPGFTETNRRKKRQ